MILLSKEKGVCMKKDLNYTKIKIIWFNQNKAFGEGQTDQGSKVFITSKSFTKDSDIKSLKSEVEVNCKIYNSRQNGLYAYESQLVTSSST